MIKTSISIKPGKLIFCISAINSFQRLLSNCKNCKITETTKNLQKSAKSSTTAHQQMQHKSSHFTSQTRIIYNRCTVCIVCKPKWSCNQARTKWVEMWRNYVVVARRRFAGILGTLRILGFLDSCTEQEIPEQSHLFHILKFIFLIHFRIKNYIKLY